MIPRVGFDWFVALSITRDVSGVVQFYRDGRPIGTPGPSAIGPTANGANLTIGYLSDGAPHDCEFNGAIDEVQVFNDKLSAAEVYAEYLAALPLPLSVPLRGFGARAATGVGLLLLGLAFARRREQRT